MSLADIMSHAGLSGYAQAGFVICLLAFLAVVVRTVFFSPEEMEARARAVLGDGEGGGREGGTDTERRENP